MTAARRLRLLFLCEGCTDIRMIAGYAARFDLLLAIPSDALVQSGLEERIRREGLALRIEVLRRGRRAFLPEAVGRLIALRACADAVLAQNNLRAALAANVARWATGRPVAAIVQTDALEYYRCKFRRGLIGSFRWILGAAAIRALQWANAKMSRRTLADGEYLRELAARDAPGARAVGAYGVDTMRYAPVDEDRKTALRRQLGLPERAVLAIFASRMAPEKDPETVLAAVRAIRAEGVDLRLVHLSGGFQEFLDLAAREGLADAVIARPAAHPIHELPGWYQACDLCVQASRAEGFGWSPLEAAACGLPAIGSDVGGLSRTLREIGWLFPVGDAAALAERIREILRDPDAARRRALAGREWVRERYDAKRVFDEFEDAIREMVPES